MHVRHTCKALAKKELLCSLAVLRLEAVPEAHLAAAIACPKKMLPDLKELRNFLKKYSKTTPDSATVRPKLFFDFSLEF